MSLATSAAPTSNGHGFNCGCLNRETAALRIRMPIRKGAPINVPKDMHRQALFPRSTAAEYDRWWSTMPSYLRLRIARPANKALFVSCRSEQALRTSLGEERWTPSRSLSCTRWSLRATAGRCARSVALTLLKIAATSAATSLRDCATSHRPRSGVGRKNLRRALGFLGSSVF